MVYNPATKLVSPQYHVVHDKSFDTVQLNMSAADAEQKLEEMLDALFVTSKWVHSDANSDDIEPHPTHHYFDSSWDLAQDMIQATCPHKCTCNHLQQEVLPLSEGVSSSHSHVSVPHHVDLSMERSSHSSTSDISTPAPVHKGAVFSNGILETDSNTHPGLQATALQQPDDNADLTNQQPSIIEASLSCVTAMTPTGDNSVSTAFERIIPIVSQFRSLELPAK